MQNICIEKLTLCITGTGNEVTLQQLSFA